MSETIYSTATTKEAQYEELFPQLQALWSGETDLVANMANTCAALQQVFHFHWIGFYLVKKDELVLGPFQGPVACTRIGLGKGVCGTAWSKKETLIVPDVNAFPGHIACSALSQSEVVVPVFERDSENIIAVLDIDSEHLDHFNETDQVWLEKMMKELMKA